MPAVSRSSAPAVFELKSAALTLIAVVVRSTDLALLATALHERLGDTPDMFEHDPVVIDITPLRDDDSSIDFNGLAALLREHRMRPVAVKGGSAAQMAAALQAGFAEAPEGVTPARPPAPAAAAATAAAAAAEVTDAAIKAPAAASASATEADPAPEPEPAAMDMPLPAAGAAATVIVDRPLRSGQQVYARNADLVVMAVVSFGAEVIADGHIHVYAPLRGRAIAGAKGNTDARIFSTCMEPQLVSIAGTYRTIEAALPADVSGRPAQVRLDGDRLVIEPLPG